MVITKILTFQCAKTNVTTTTRLKKPMRKRRRRRKAACECIQPRISIVIRASLRFLWEFFTEHWNALRSATSRSSLMNVPRLKMPFWSASVALTYFLSLNLRKACCFSFSETERWSDSLDCSHTSSDFIRANDAGMQKCTRH